jgi:hypothetical protein
MNSALMVLNPRDIPYCMAALRSLRVPTCWVSYWNEGAAAVHVNEQIEMSRFDRYTVISDDCEPKLEALASVLECHDDHPDKCVTGYSNFDKHLPFVNLCWNKLPPPPPHMDSYRFLTRAKAEEALERGPVMTTFAGLSFTTMTRKLWLEFPLEVSQWGGQMDYILSYRLQQSRIPMVAAPGGFVFHHKDKFGVYPDASPEKQLFVGKREAVVTWTGLEADFIPHLELRSQPGYLWAVRFYEDGTIIKVPYSLELPTDWAQFPLELERMFNETRETLWAA